MQLRKGKIPPLLPPSPVSSLLSTAELLLFLHFSLIHAAAHFFTFHPLIHSFQPDPNLKLLCKKPLIAIKWLNIKCAFQTVSQITSWEHLTLSITIPKRWVLWGSLMNCEASLPFHMLPLFAVFFLSPYLSQWKPTYPSQNLPLNPRKNNSSLLSAASHAPCSRILFYVWLCLAFSCLRGWTLGTILRSFRAGTALFTFILQLSTYNKHLINAYWKNELILLWCTFRVKFSSVVHLCPTLCDPMDCSTPGLPVHHQLPEFTQTHVHWVSDAIQPSHPLLSPSPPAFNLFQHQGIFKWISSSHQVNKVLEFQLQHQSFQGTPRTTLL